ncbi:hypothetical protein WJX73_005908 [Symbiochloris irregularis]|uniref:Pseudouridine synthase RsuA/RluA-like domain-containing protein n=1 Tax=Symbiochloris irregularis TaxID=706552 RepID=A0AAW1NSK6_9CHLO
MRLLQMPPALQPRLPPPPSTAQLHRLRATVISSDDFFRDNQEPQLDALPGKWVQDNCPPSPISTSASKAASEKAPAHWPGFAVVARCTVPQGYARTQLPTALAQLLPDHFTTITSSRKACRRQEIHVNGTPQKNQGLVSPGDIVFEDDHMACIVKPQGASVQGDGQGKQALKLCLKPSSQIGVLQQPRHVHRLDTELGGLLMVAKTRQAFRALSEAFGAREVSKQFTALVGGRLQGRGTIQYPLDGQPCATEWQAMSSVQSRRHGWITTVRIKPITVHQNQLRRHMALIGHPIIGDRRYSYSYAKQYQQHHKLAHDWDQDTEDCSTVEAVDVNSAYVALKRMGRMTPTEVKASTADDMSASTAKQRMAYEARTSKPPHPPLRQRPNTYFCATQEPTVVGQASKTMRGATPVSRSPLTQWPLCLWASSLSLTHPHTGELMRFEAKQPSWFGDVTQGELAAWQEHKFAQSSDVKTQQEVEEQLEPVSPSEYHAAAELSWAQTPADQVKKRVRIAQPQRSTQKSFAKSC